MIMSSGTDPAISPCSVCGHPARMSGMPEITYAEKFPDVPDAMWYTQAILWANSIDVVKGYSNSGLFGVSDNINREQMAVMLYRYAEYMGYDTSMKVDFSSFSDAAV